jgi:hypothetical protein
MAPVPTTLAVRFKVFSCVAQTLESLIAKVHEAFTFIRDLLVFVALCIRSDLANGRSLSQRPARPSTSLKGFATSRIICKISNSKHNAI